MITIKDFEELEIGDWVLLENPGSVHNIGSPEHKRFQLYQVKDIDESCGTFHVDGLPYDIDSYDGVVLVYE